MKLLKALLAALSILFLVVLESHGQQYAITSAGDHSTANGHQLTWSLVRVSVFSSTNHNIYLGSGIHTGENQITILLSRS
ncbi:hypothetical protein N7E81_14880 [Reichenbachiella carrageenanivorans]|uniref:Uncharacterized protein n=1 Tax=Reichenbachiella carrageenanivorans TaxID=2979869 RepID=A0ABY6D0Q7_9BACT|nr:hypothetical protein [Reichenbachiella carrageenanivorans]UXX78643.1 hypothetical protein N7E81_14880 [Reichenbachiella carrageenanivorans]